MTSDIDSFFALVAERVLPELLKLDADSAGIRHWFVIEDAIGVEVADGDEDTDSSKALMSFAEKDANAAYVTYSPGPPHEHVLAYAVMAGPTNSDVRRSAIIRSGESLTLGPWEYTV
jgi:hypothetical protein